MLEVTLNFRSSELATEGEHGSFWKQNGQREIGATPEIRYFNEYLMNADHGRARRSQSNFFQVSVTIA